MNKSKTFVLAAMLLLCAAVVFAGAGQEAKPAATQTGEKFLIGISQPFMGHPIRQAGTVLINAWLKDHPEVTVMVTDGQLNASKQIADIEDMITKKVDIILVAAHQSPTLVRVLREAKEAGIPIIAFDRTLTDPSVQVGMVVNDDYEAGASAARLLVEKLGGKGNVVSLQGPAGNTTVTLRQGGFLSVISQYPGIKLIDDQVANFQRVQAVDVFENILQAHPGLDGVYCHNDEMALGVVKVLKDAGIKNKIVVGVDGQKDALEAIMAGDLYATVRKVVEFPAALDMALEYLKTGKTATMNYLDPIPITKDNVAKYYDPNAVF
jgi:ribose transport system substrate-binding protein